MFKSAESSSLAPGQSSKSQAQASSSSSQTKTSQYVVPSSSSDGDSSQFVFPSTFDGVSSQPTKHKDDEDNRDWLVDVIDQHQVTKTVRMKIKDVHNLENGKRIIVECDEYSVPIGKAGGIIAGVMGQLATNALYFPISFKKWLDMPKSYLDHVFDEILMARFLFMIDRKKAKSWISSNLSKKWKDHRHKLWHAAEDPLLSKEEIIRKSPNGIPMDQWALFVNYRMDEKTRILDISNSSLSLSIASSLSLLWPFYFLSTTSSSLQCISSQPEVNCSYCSYLTCRNFARRISRFDKSKFLILEVLRVWLEEELKW